MKALPVLLVVYAAASLLHFVHNAEFLADYPNMPGSITRPAVYWTWLGFAAIGLAGYLLLRRGQQATGLSLIALYAVLGFDSLGHYALAPVGAHTWAMNLTIWLEALAAAGLFLVTASLLGRRMRAWRAS
jgi:hypothetical protein